MITSKITIPFIGHDSELAYRWSQTRAQEWFDKNGWVVGCNYIPSNAINQLEMWQEETFSPEIIDKELEVTMAATVPANTKITFNPASFTLAKGATKTVGITIESTAPVNSQQFAAVRFNTPKGNARIPVAFVPKQGSVSLTQGCAPGSVRRNASTVCTVSAANTSFTDQDVDFTTTVNNRLRLTAASGATLSNNRVRKTGTLAGASLGVPSLAPGTVAGYIPLDLFGGTLQTAVGDETMTNFNVPAFTYNGAVATQVGVDSNGYLVVGGGTAADNNCCNLPLGPSSERPNNILAPFWTDLDGTGAPGILVNVLTDGVSTWLVVEWRVNVFGTTDTRVFQTWIGVDGTQDIAYSYANAMAAPGAQDYLVGAENAAGEGDVSRFLPTEDQRVTSTDPTPGATVTYTVTVRGTTVGAGNVHTDLIASGVKGVTTADTPVTVTP